ncbi:amidohydrolase family protein [Psychrosphaera sp. 1_MG-2023]|uniref:amidohydrolase family protein n=1 Tax=Psychrosphaera sp. 1_MG-2023 TaxID=3062643 RepID=UPI0026E1D62C|nr:amidohydrolase family protein [Psychrosphaera sp. 1_MG-2023]MDO6720721.1 amidohydrolase family protein [Psychrosphaera sp. 1_MG-2023]
MKIIDPHIHLFDLSKGEYGWLKPENQPNWPDKSRIFRSFSEEDLTLGVSNKLAGFVHIEAGFDNNAPWREIEWLERICQKPFKSIAAIDLTLPPASFKHQVSKLKVLNSVVGVRHILDDDLPAILSHQNTANNLLTLDNLGWIFELQFDLNNTDFTLLCVDKLTPFNNIKFTLNHCGFINLSHSEINSQFYQNLISVSQLPNIAVKCSGWEMIDRAYGFADVHSAVLKCIDIFGPKKVMYASNFPLCTFSYGYQQYWQELNKLNIVHAQALFHDNAHTWYQF